MTAALRTFVVHLRLPFQLALAPFFLLGTYLSGVRPGAGWALTFVLVHVGLYGGATVYNGFYDKDEGPIGMLKRPPPVTRAHKNASLALQLGAVVVICLQSLQAGGVAALLFAMGVAYSHPVWRFKGRTFSGLALVSLGQGALSVLLGFFAATDRAPEPLAWQLAGTASLLVAGLYPLTQIYQIDEDRARGDRTLPVRYGWRATMAYAGLASGLGLAVLTALLRAELPAWWPGLVLAALVALAVYLVHWARRFELLGPYGNHDRAMALSIAVSVPVCGLLAYVLWVRWAG